MSIDEYSSVFQTNSMDKIKIEMKFIGEGKFPVLIADNIYKDPCAIRDHILQNQFYDDDKYEEYVFNPELKIQKNVRKIIEKYAYDYFDFCFEDFDRLSKNDFAIRNLNELKYNMSPTPHTDESVFAGVLYLNETDNILGGTSFFRNIFTGLEGELKHQIYNLLMNKNNDLEEQQLKILDLFKKYKLYENFTKVLDKYEISDVDTVYNIHSSYGGFDKNLKSQKNDYWVEYDQVDFKFNRLIIYPAFLFHSPTIIEKNFKGDKKEQRLTQRFFALWSI